MSAKILNFPNPPAVIAAELLAACAHRTGKYADAYRLGLSVAAGEIEPAQDPKALGQGYADGLALRPVRVPKSGKGSLARQAARMKRLSESSKRFTVTFSGELADMLVRLGDGDGKKGARLAVTVAYRERFGIY